MISLQHKVYQEGYLVLVFSDKVFSVTLLLISSLYVTRKIKNAVEFQQVYYTISTPH